MDIFSLFPRELSEARIIQRSLQRMIKVKPLNKKPNYVTAVDASFYKDYTIASACTYEYDSLTLIEEATFIQKTYFPYIPGFLAFREGPTIIETLKKLKKKPDVIIFDGHGIAHPCGIGIASHVGVLLNASTIGCAKSRLVGD
ncbi:MAG: endonuclease V, partial [Thermodesulfovibrionales bacterium]